MAKIDSAYAYYVSNYAHKEVSRYDSHKKSDLRKVYNKIIKANKESPLYKISNLSEAKKYAIDIKESSKNIQNAVASLSDSYGSFADSFQKKVAVSSDPDSVDVKYVGDGNEENNSDGFDISVDKIATPQINTGNFLNNKALSFVPGNYSFNLDTTNSAYEFQFTVSQGENNSQILNKLSDLINNASLGITSHVIDNSGNESALQLTSSQTGLSESEKYLFSISPTASSDSIAGMKTLGINRVTSEASNSSFTLNGKEHSSLSNTFTINNVFELTLNKETDASTPVSIRFKTNSDAVADNVQILIDAYNGILDTAKEHPSDKSGSNKLLRDMSSISTSRKASLEYIGLMTSDDGKITIDKDILSNAVQPDRADATFHTLSAFRDMIGDKASSASVNPMDYVPKVVVAYKNPGHNFNTPYISSIYAGMMLDSFA